MKHQITVKQLSVFQIKTVIYIPHSVCFFLITNNDKKIINISQIANTKCLIKSLIHFQIYPQSTHLTH